MLLLGEHQVNGPATADMGRRTAEVIEDSLVHAAGLFKGIGQDGGALGVQLAAR
jgi:hypothetical protein